MAYQWYKSSRTRPPFWTLDVGEGGSWNVPMVAARLEHAATLQASCAARMPFPTPQSSRKRMVWGLRPRHPLTPSLLSNAHLHAIGFVLRSMCTATNAIALCARLEQCGYLRVLAVRVSELLKLVSVRETNAAWLLAVLCGNHLADVRLAFLVDVEQLANLSVHVA